jgi:hypothetical protein
LKESLVLLQRERIDTNVGYLVSRLVDESLPDGRGKYRVTFPRFDHVVYTVASSPQQAMSFALVQLVRDKPYLKGRVFRPEWLNSTSEYVELVESVESLVDELIDVDYKGSESQQTIFDIYPKLRKLKKKTLWWRQHQRPHWIDATVGVKEAKSSR